MDSSGRKRAERKHSSGIGSPRLGGSQRKRLERKEEKKEASGPNSTAQGSPRQDDRRSSLSSPRKSVGRRGSRRPGSDAADSESPRSAARKSINSNEEGESSSHSRRRERSEADVAAIKRALERRARSKERGERKDRPKAVSVEGRRRSAATSATTDPAKQEGTLLLSPRRGARRSSRSRRMSRGESASHLAERGESSSEQCNLNDSQVIAGLALSPRKPSRNKTAKSLRERSSSRQGRKSKRPSASSTEGRDEPSNSNSGHDRSYRRRSQTSQARFSASSNDSGTAINKESKEVQRRARSSSRGGGGRSSHRRVSTTENSEEKPKEKPTVAEDSERSTTTRSKYSSSSDSNHESFHSSIRSLKQTASLDAMIKADSGTLVESDSIDIQELKKWGDEFSSSILSFNTEEDGWESQTVNPKLCVVRLDSPELTSLEAI